jgi:acid phosphatase
MLAAVLFAATACGNGASKATLVGRPSVTANSAGASHVVLVVLANQNYADVVGSANAPYINSLISEGTLATNYYANTHPSIGNYFMMTTGAIVTNNNAYTGSIPPPEIVSALTDASKTWKVYAEGIPSVGYTGPSTGLYLKRLNPLSYFADVVGKSAADNIVPLSGLALSPTGELPGFTMVVGNIYDSGSNCQPTATTCTPAVQLQQADTWLSNTLPLFLTNESFLASGLLIVTFDQSATDNANGGGRVATVLVGTNVQVGYKALGLYQHQSLLRLILEAQSVTALPNAAATAPPMNEIWK